MSKIEQLKAAFEAVPGTWSKSKCGCGHRACSSYFLNFTRSDGRMDEVEADLAVLMKESLPVLLEDLYRQYAINAALLAAAKNALFLLESRRLDGGQVGAELLNAIAKAETANA